MMRLVRTGWHILTHHNGTGRPLTGWEMVWGSWMTLIVTMMFAAIMWGVLAVGPGQ